MAEKGIIKYKITDNLFICRDIKGVDKLVYVVDSSKEKYDQILNMREIENKVNKAIQKYIEFLSIDTKESLNKIKLFIFLLKVRLYEQYILRNLFINLLFNEYKQLANDDKLALVLIEYLLDEELMPEKDKIIIKNIDLFNKLYSSFKRITLGMPKYIIISVYYKFLDTLRAENIPIQES